jgi:L-fuconolactonase
MSTLGVIDSHIHFWDPERLHYPWLGQEPRLHRSFQPTDLSPGAVPVDGVVFIEADRRPAESQAEVEWALGLSSPALPVLGVVAAAALEQPGVDHALEALQRHQEVRGVRRLLQDAPRGFCTAPAFVRGVAALGARGLVFDVCVRHHQLPEVAELARRCPEVTFVLDHVGKPEVRALPDQSWQADIARLAAQPNVWCKLSGLATEVVDHIGPDGMTGLVGPHLEHALQRFGPSRCLFGSDWPVASLAISYEGWFDQVTAALDGFSATEAENVLRRNAIQVYRLGEPWR